MCILYGKAVFSPRQLSDKLNSLTVSEIVLHIRRLYPSRYGNDCLNVDVSSNKLASRRKALIFP